jgi:hypothetical protein
MSQQGYPALPNTSESVTYLFEDIMDKDSMTISGNQSSPPLVRRESSTDGSPITTHRTQLSNSSEWLDRVSSLFQKAAGGSDCPLPFLPILDDKKCGEATYVKELHAFLTRLDLEAPKEMFVSDTFHHISHDITVMMALGADGAPAGDGQAADGQATDGQATDGQAGDGKAGDGKAADGQAADGKHSSSDDSPQSSDGDGIGPTQNQEPYISKKDLDFLKLSKYGLTRLKKTGLDQLYSNNGWLKPTAQPKNKRKKPDSIERMVDDLRKKQKVMWEDKTTWAKGECEDHGLNGDGEYAVLQQRILNYGTVRLVHNPKLLLELLEERDLETKGNDCARLLSLILYEWNANHIRCEWDDDYVFEERGPDYVAGDRRYQSPSLTPPAVKQPTVYTFATRKEAEDYGKANKWTVISNFESMGNALFRRVEVIGDGNCLLRAFARAYYGHENRHRQVRVDLFKYWDAVEMGHTNPSNPLNVARANLYLQIEHGILVKQNFDPSIDAIHDQITKGGTWCTDDVLQVIADVYGVTIVMWEQNVNPTVQSDYTILLIRGSAPEAHTQRQIHLEYLTDHYRAFIPIQISAESKFRYTDHVPILQGPVGNIPQIVRYFPLYDPMSASNTCILFPDLQWTPQADTAQGPRYPGFKR